MNLRTAIVVLLVILTVSVNGAAWTGVWLLNRASEVRAEQAERAEERAERSEERADRAEEITLEVQHSIRRGVVCILGQIAGRGDIERPSEPQVEEACRAFLADDDNGG